MKFLSRFQSGEVIEIRDGEAVSVKGRHARILLGDVEDVCREFGVSKGRIVLGGNGKLSFSKHIPSAAHQALRNVIVNHL